MRSRPCSIVITWAACHSDDPRLVATNALAGVRVLITMVGGRVEYCAPEAGMLCVLAT